MGKLVPIVCLIIGVIGVSVMNSHRGDQIEKLQTEVTELQSRNEVLKSLLDKSVKMHAVKLAEAKEENFIFGPGKLHPREVDLHNLLFIFLQSHEAVCFGKGWLRK